MKRFLQFLFLFTLGGFIAVGCQHNDNTQKPSDRNKYFEEIVDDTANFEPSAISPVLTAEIEDYIAKHCDWDEEKIIILWEENGFMFMVSNYFYDSKKLLGYSIIDDKMIAYYGSENEVSPKLLDVEKLKLGCPDTYPDDKSSIAFTWDYDPKMRKYRVVDADSLVLEYEGY